MVVLRGCDCAGVDQRNGSLRLLPELKSERGAWPAWCAGGLKSRLEASAAKSPFGDWAVPQRAMRVPSALQFRGVPQRPRAELYALLQSWERMRCESRLSGPAGLADTSGACWRARAKMSR